MFQNSRIRGRALANQVRALQNDRRRLIRREISSRFRNESHAPQMWSRLVCNLGPREPSSRIGYHPFMEWFARKLWYPTTSANWATFLITFIQFWMTSYAQDRVDALQMKLPYFWLGNLSNTIMVFFPSSSWGGMPALLIRISSTNVMAQLIAIV